jgi:uncharacterized protein YgiM (DUF1202 family)
MKLNKKTKAALLIGVPLLIGGFLIYRQFRKPRTITTTTGGGGNNGGNNNPPPPPPPAPTTSCNNYIVTTVSSNLNIRSTASTSGAIVGSLPKGSTVSAKQSSTSGWMELCDGRGFVSGQYLTLTS